MDKKVPLLFKIKEKIITKNCKNEREDLTTHLVRNEEQDWTQKKIKASICNDLKKKFTINLMKNVMNLNSKTCKRLPRKCKDLNKLRNTGWGICIT